MSKCYSEASMKVSEIELQMNRNLMAVECDVRTCVLSVYYIDTVYNNITKCYHVLTTLDNSAELRNVILCGGF
jgi:hypothetical protein